MINSWLLVDLGASRIKSSIFNKEKNTSYKTIDLPSPQPIVGKIGNYEIFHQEHPTIFRKILNHYQKEGIDINAIFLCAEMHGFLLVDETTRQPLTNYISWKDTRSTYDFTIDKLNPIKEKFKKITGMNLKPGLPLVTLVSLIQKLPPLEHPIIFLSLPEWIIESIGIPYGLVNETMAAGSGLYDIYQKEWSNDLINMIHPYLKGNQVTKELNSPLGSISYQNKNIPVFGGTGDLQTATLGVGLRESEAYFNLGTGSQVITMNEVENQKLCEKRPYFFNKTLNVVSHIPSGRVLTVFQRFFDELKKEEGWFWKYVFTLSADEILESSLDINLSIYKNAYNYKEGGSIFNLQEENFTSKNFINSLIRCYAEQYIHIMNDLSFKIKPKKIRLGGGIIHRIPAIAQVMRKLAKSHTVVTSSNKEETLKGMSFLVEKMNIS